jgi:hypothetical protein
MDKHSILQQVFINYKSKKADKIAHSSQFYKTFLYVIYTFDI